MTGRCVRILCDDGNAVLCFCNICMLSLWQALVDGDISIRLAVILHIWEAASAVGVLNMFKAPAYPFHYTLYSYFPFRQKKFYEKRATYNLSALQ